MFEKLGELPKMWHRDMKWAKVFEKMVPIDLIEVALPQILKY